MWPDAERHSQLVLVAHMPCLKHSLGQPVPLRLSLRPLRRHQANVSPAGRPIALTGSKSKPSWPEPAPRTRGSVAHPARVDASAYRPCPGSSRPARRSAGGTARRALLRCTPGTGIRRWRDRRHIVPHDFGPERQAILAEWPRGPWQLRLGQPDYTGGWFGCCFRGHAGYPTPIPHSLSAKDRQPRGLCDRVFLRREAPPPVSGVRCPADPSDALHEPVVGSNRHRDGSHSQRRVMVRLSVTESEVVISSVNS